MAGEAPSLYDSAMKFSLPGSKMLGNAIEKNPSRTDVAERIQRCCSRLFLQLRPTWALAKWLNPFRAQTPRNAPGL
jgi:hypothetical protein